MDYYCSDCIKRATCQITQKEGFSLKKIYEELQNVSDIINEKYKVRVTFGEIDFNSCSGHVEDFEEVHYDLSCGTLYLCEIKDKVEDTGHNWKIIEKYLDIDHFCRKFIDMTMTMGWHDALLTVAENEIDDILDKTRSFFLRFFLSFFLI